MTGTDVTRYADMAMYRAVPTSEDGEEVTPKVHMLSGTPDPLGAMAAASLMYQGKPVRNVSEVTDDQRRWFFEDIKKTALDSPFEFIDMHFIIEGVTRGFTHQLVRQRVGAVYVQESQRFAVKENGAHEVGLPPSLAGTWPSEEQTDRFRDILDKRGIYASVGSTAEGQAYNEAYYRLRDELSEAQKRRFVWDEAVEQIANAYNELIDMGMPAEDARGLLPTNITTRVHYKTNLRSLMQHAGNRLCTQAQFEWRHVWTQFIAAMRGYSTDPTQDVHENGTDRHDDNWQWNLIADVFRPVCYRTGKCEFKSDMDRHCSIRERVNDFERTGTKSDEWDAPKRASLAPIFPAEWLLNPAAARRKA